jgi:hypothetical protein
VSGSHSLAPDIFELAEACEGMDAAAKLAAARPLDPNASGEWVGGWVLCLRALHVGAARYLTVCSFALASKAAQHLLTSSCHPPALAWPGCREHERADCGARRGGVPRGAARPLHRHWR